MTYSSGSLAGAGGAGGLVRRESTMSPTDNITIPVTVQTMCAVFMNDGMTSPPRTCKYRTFTKGAAFWVVVDHGTSPLQSRRRFRPPCQSRVVCLCATRQCRSGRRDRQCDPDREVCLCSTRRCRRMYEISWCLVHAVRALHSSHRCKRLVDIRPVYDMLFLHSRLYNRPYTWLVTCCRSDSKTFRCRSSHRWTSNIGRLIPNDRTLP